MSNKDSVSRTLIVAFLVCLVCSVVVSVAAVSLRPAQQLNKALDKQRNILAAAGLLQEGLSIEEQFARIEPRVVDMQTGRFSDAHDPSSYDQRRAAGDPARSIELSNEDDIANVQSRAKFALVYLVRDERGQVEKLVLPMHGYGLWSTMYGFLALENDYNTVAGLGFYEHGETPGLGGEIDNPRWRSLWVGKKVYRASEPGAIIGGEPELRVIKGPAPALAEHQIDGLAGATLTANGVSNMLRFWFGGMGFGTFLRNMQAGSA